MSTVIDEKNKIAYVKHPITKEDVSELRKNGYEILDIRFVPKELLDDKDGEKEIVVNGNDDETVNNNAAGGSSTNGTPQQGGATLTSAGVVAAPSPATTNSDGATNKGKAAKGKGN